MGRRAGWRPTTGGHRRGLAALVAVGLALGIVGTVAPVGALDGPAADAPTLEVADVPPTTAPVDRRLVEAGRDVSEAESHRVALVGAIADLDAALVSLDGRIADLDADLAPARAELDLVDGRLQGRAGQVYRQHGAGLGAALSLAGPSELAAGVHYADALAVVDGAGRNRLQAVVDDMEGRRAALEVQRRDRGAERDRRAGELVVARVRADEAAARLATLGGTPVMGIAPVTAVGLAAWFRSTGHVAVLADPTTIEDLAEYFVAEGGAEGVRADLAFAQAVVETGWFAHAGDNNFAGIGACDSCDGREIGFRTPHDGVRAQIQLLRNYAEPGVRSDQLRNPPEATLHGADPAAAVRVFDGFSAKGTAPVWDAMGGGRWATDPDYARKVLAVAAGIRAFTTDAG